MSDQKSIHVEHLRLLHERYYLRLPNGENLVKNISFVNTKAKYLKQLFAKKIKSFAPIVHKKYFILSLTCLAGFVFIAIAACGIIYFHRPIKLAYNLDNLKVDSPIAIIFSQPVQKSISYSIVPSIEGSWKTSKNLFGITTLKFFPSKSLIPGSSYQLMVKNIKPLLASQPTLAVKSIPVMVEKPAAISAITPASDSNNVAIDSSVTLKLASPNRGLRKLLLKADASLISEEPSTTDDTTFVWKFAQPLKQGQSYSLTIFDMKQSEKIKQILLTTKFVTVPEPHFVSASNTDHFYPGDKINITFDQDMKKLDAIFKFGFAGTGHWQDYRTYIFEPSGLIPGSGYTYTVFKGSESIAGGVLEADHVFNISPPGAAYVTGSSPKGNNIELGSAVSFTFDQPIDHSTAQAAFSISPTVNGSFSWSGNTMTFKSVGLEYQTNYIATIGLGVKGIYGLTSTRNFTNSFTTTYRILKLGVPYYRQAYALSCEEASLRMALAYRGINVSDYDILTQVGYSPRPRDSSNNSWDDPNQMFVGDVNGKMGTTGWGVYGQPLVVASQKLGRNASSINGITVNQIAQAIYDNNPVVLWGYTGTSVRHDSWNTPNGVVQAPKNTHVRNVYGVVGNVSNPIGFYIHDPLYGEIYWTTAQLQSNMSFGYSLPSRGVIVY
ncbi:MAG: Ig-like domain-containing protein [Candidatus Saccharibacteria bacterium]